MSCIDYKGSYNGYIRRKRRFLALLALLTVFAALTALAFGSAALSPRETAAALLGFGSPQAHIILFHIRLPRVLTAIVAGIGLAASGCVMQSLLKNPLASASTLGVSQGAAFGAAFAITVFNAGMQSLTPDAVSFTNPYLIFLCAFAGSMLPTAAILLLARFRRVSAEVMILAGKIFKGGYVLFGCINCLKTSYTWLGDDKKIHFVCPNCGSKTEAGKNRVIPIHNDILPLVEKRYNPNNERLIELLNETSPYNQYRKYFFDPVMEFLNIKHLPHDGRHTFASFADRSQANPLSIKRIIGHKSQDFTKDVYTHKTIEELVEAVNMIHFRK